MLNDQILNIEEPNDSKQQLHLLDMNSFFGNRIEVEPVDEASFLHYQYGVEHTKDFNEFCDTMHTALYWLNTTYADAFVVDKAAEALNLCNNVDKIDEDMYRIDLIFGAWLAFVVCDSEKMRSDFLNELSGMTEEEFLVQLDKNSQNLRLVETFTINWIKKMIDPARAAAYGHYMLYMMLKVATGQNEPSVVLTQVMTDLFIFTQSAARLYIMDQHNLPMN